MGAVVDPAAGPRAVRFRSTPATTVVSHEDRIAAGLDHWVYGSMGILRTNDRTLAIAPNGPRLARHDLAAGGFVGGLVSASDTIAGLGPDVAHASGGPLFHDRPTGLTMLVYHGETFADGDPTDYWAFLGMAVSQDEGTTFTDLGRILTSTIADSRSAGPRPVEVGPGGFVIRNGWWYLYFQDRAIDHIRVNLGVARARVDAVLAAVAAGRAPTFHKFARGRWDQPGLGGVADDLFAGRKHPVLWYDVAHLAAIDATLVVYSSVRRVKSGAYEWLHLGAVSHDGIHFSEAAPLSPDSHGDELLYLTIDSGGPDQRVIRGDRFDLYRVQSTERFRWNGAHLERFEVVWQ